MSQRVLPFGIPSEPPIAMGREALEAIGADYVMVSQRRFADTHVSFAIETGTIRGSIVVGDAEYRLDDFRGAYMRAMDDRCLPELASQPSSSTLHHRAQAVYLGLAQWAEVTSARVVNRVGPMGSNISKPYQAQLIQRCGFGTPETLITNDPEEVRVPQRPQRRRVEVNKQRSINRADVPAPRPRQAPTRAGMSDAVSGTRSRRRYPRSRRRLAGCLPRGSVATRPTTDTPAAKTSR